MFVVKNKETGLFIKAQSGSFYTNYRRYKNGWGSSCWTEDLNLARVYKSKGGVKNSIGEYARDSNGQYIPIFYTQNGRQVRRYKRRIPNWAEIIEIAISKVMVK